MPGSKSGRERTASIREVTSGGGHAGGSVGPVHFGLGKRDEADVRVLWPDGEVGEWQTVKADQVVTITRGTKPA